MRTPTVAAALGALVAGCQAACQPPPPSAPPEPPRAVASQPSGFKQCDAGALGYPDAPNLPPPAHVEFAHLPLDPAFQKMGIRLVTFRSAEMVFHVSPEVSQAMVDCTVAAADDAVAFVTNVLRLSPVFDGGPKRDVFLLLPGTAAEVLERLDPGYGFAMDTVDGQAFVGHPRARKDASAIILWKPLSLGYLELGGLVAHEWVHMVQRHIRGNRPSEIETVVEGEANYVYAMFQDATVPGAGSLFWEWDASQLARVRQEHPELTAYELLTQPPHRFHQELTLFAYLTRDLDPPTLTRVRLLARDERIDYETASKSVARRDLVDSGVDAIRS
jgi:hypothetical protein